MGFHLPPRTWKGKTKTEEATIIIQPIYDSIYVLRTCQKSCLSNWNGHNSHVSTTQTCPFQMTTPGLVIHQNFISGRLELSTFLLQTIWNYKLGQACHLPNLSFINPRWKLSRGGTLVRDLMFFRSLPPRQVSRHLSWLLNNHELSSLLIMMVIHKYRLYD